MIDKTSVIRLFQEKIKNSISLIQDSLNQLETSLHEETKSSAGDKYETSREMIQAEMDRLEAQKQQHILDLATFQTPSQHSNIQAGSLVHLKIDEQEHHLFIAAAIGTILIDSLIVRSISTQSPLGLALLGRLPQERFSWNLKSIHILNCY